MADSKLKNRQTDLLVRALLSLETEEQCYQLLEDLLTIREVRDLSQRLEVAQMLKNKVTYTEIVASTGVSTATIGRPRASSVRYSSSAAAAVAQGNDKAVRERTRRHGVASRRGFAEPLCLSHVPPLIPSGTLTKNNALSGVIFVSVPKYLNRL